MMWPSTLSVFLDFTPPKNSVTSSDKGNWAERKETEKNNRYAHHHYFINYLSAQRGRPWKCTQVKFMVCARGLRKESQFDESLTQLGVLKVLCDDIKPRVDMYVYVPKCKFMYPFIVALLVCLDRQCVRELRQRMIGAYSDDSNIQFSIINGHQRSTGCLAVVACVYYPLLRALRAITMSPVCATVAPLQ